MSGVVYLVGAGPGDPKLITVRGAEVLARADVVVFDRLASPALLELAPGHAERIYVGKEPGRAARQQEEIDALLVARALTNETVVRLKGGDPFVFGRGDSVDLASIATATDTLVLLMAAGKLEETCRTLIEAGRSPDEPAAIVQWATTEDQREVVGTLAELPALALAASIGPPATLIVGEVVGLGGSLRGSIANRSGGVGSGDDNPNVEVPSRPTGGAPAQVGSGFIGRP